MNTILDSKDDIIGIIYKIQNTITNKIYIGQTVSHRKNHNRYRPFGHIGRFKDHISEALCNTKKNQCTYLNQAIRKYKPQSFVVEQLEECPITNLNEREIYFISLYNSLYPNGYNLTIGGKNTYVAKVQKTYDNILRPITNKERSETTKNKISEGVKKFYEEHEDKKLDLIKRVQKQHYSNKLKIGSQYDIDENNLDQYISIRKKAIVIIFERKRDGKKVHFYIAKNESILDTILRAKKYLYDVISYRKNSCDITKLRETPKASTTNVHEESCTGSGEKSEVW